MVAYCKEMAASYRNATVTQLQASLCLDIKIPVGRPSGITQPAWDR